MDSIYVFADTFPEYAGVESDMLQEIQKNLNVPSHPSSPPQSKFLVEMVIEKDGSVSKVSSNANDEFVRDEFDRVFGALRFIPAKHKGEMVRFRMVCPVYIHLK